MFFRSGPLDWYYWPSGKLDLRMYDGLQGGTLHRIMLIKILWKGMGTWGSNPGPVGYQCICLPIVPLAPFEYIIRNK